MIGRQDNVNLLCQQSISVKLLLFSGCRMNGQLVTEHKDVGIPEDPCVKCRCKNGKLTCRKQACPVLHCPGHHIYRVPGECCNQCHGSRYLLEPPKGSCMMELKVYSSGNNFRPDHCTHCTCLNGTSLCRRQTCPILDCIPARHVTTPGICCPSCSPDNEFEQTCYYGGHTYKASVILFNTDTLF